MRSDVGKYGEEITCKFLVKLGHTILERNFRKKWGEIDIVSEYRAVTHFVEVKTVLKDSRSISETDSYRPEENVHPMKLRRLARTIQTYLLERNISHNWQFDVVVVFLDPDRREAKIRMIENVVL